MKNYTTLLFLTLLSMLMIASAYAAAPASADTRIIESLIKSKVTASIAFGKIAQEGSFVIAQWHTTDGNSAGESLLKKTGSTWAIVVNGGGSVATSAAFLEAEGVPSANATSLVTDIGD